VSGQSGPCSGLVVGRSRAIQNIRFHVVAIKHITRWAKTHDNAERLAIVKLLGSSDGEASMPTPLAPGHALSLDAEGTRSKAVERPPKAILLGLKANEREISGSLSTAGS
jgi:hypothetical protein